MKDIGDYSRDGLLQITDTRWDSNGTLFVTVRETMGGNCLIGGFPIKRGRTLARSALMFPHLTNSSRVVNRFKDGACDAVTYAVSRNERI